MSKNKVHTENQSKPESPKLSKAKKVFNRMTLLFVLFVAAGGTAIYINNVMRINKMLNEIRSLEKKRDSLVSMNQHLKSKVLDMQSASRITELAKQRLGMIPNPKAPTSITP
ncbi:MAG: FtsB family cell division protein [Candidatus Kapaibacteriota bacterium]|jgi:cell division protein FtsL